MHGFVLFSSVQCGSYFTREIKEAQSKVFAVTLNFNFSVLISLPFTVLYPLFLKACTLRWSPSQWNLVHFGCLLTTATPVWSPQLAMVVCSQKGMVDTHLDMRGFYGYSHFLPQLWPPHAFNLCHATRGINISCRTCLSVIVKLKKKVQFSSYGIYIVKNDLSVLENGKLR